MVGNRRAAATIVLLAAVIALGGCAGKVRELMPAPANEGTLVGLAQSSEVPEARRRSDVDLLFITDRARETAPEADLPYGEGRSRSLAFGSATVRLMPEMTWDELRQQSLSDPRTEQIAMELGSVRELGRYPEEPYRVRAGSQGVERDPVVLAQHDRAEDELQAEVQRRIQTAPSGQVMLFVHGFNETFATGAYTAADLCHFFGRRHVCAFFTWPAEVGGNPLFAYTQTTESAQFSVAHLKKTIRSLANTPGVEGVQLLAHSRGTAVLLNAYRELAIEAIVAGKEPAEALKLENLVLLSPDIDGDVASQQIEVFVSDPNLHSSWSKAAMPRFFRNRLTIYASPEDRALKLSTFLFRSSHRVGQLQPGDLSPNTQQVFSTLGVVDAIVYDGERTDKFGHSYFMSNPRVSADLVELVVNNTPPGTPRRPLIRTSKVTWAFPDS
jgi:esterase/lipase superfamily enzyme